MPLKLKKCPFCNEYNLTSKCRSCGKETKEAHYKFIKIRDAPNSDNFFKEN